FFVTKRTENGRFSQGWAILLEALLLITFDTFGFVWASVTFSHSCFHKVGLLISSLRWSFGQQLRFRSPKRQAVVVFHGELTSNR
ncbi:MAG: hypothetical protein P8Y51_04065, partial [Campylobacterales bacterium]